MKSNAKQDDSRVRRTRRALISAMVELVLEKRYATVTIQNLLDRAQVGRATFYSHYRGKDDLLLRSFEGMLGMLDEHMDRDCAASGRLAPVRELFEHVGQSRRFHQALARAHMLEQLYQAGTECMSASIRARLDKLRPSRLAHQLPNEVLARALAGALFALLARWIAGESAHTPDQMDAMFHAIHPLPNP